MDITQNLDSLTITERESKAGKPYYILSVKFNTGYVFETFLNNEQLFILKNLSDPDEYK